MLLYIFLMVPGRQYNFKRVDMSSFILKVNVQRRNIAQQKSHGDKEIYNKHNEEERRRRAAARKRKEKGRKRKED